MEGEKSLKRAIVTQSEHYISHSPTQKKTNVLFQNLKYEQRVIRKKQRKNEQKQRETKKTKSGI